MAATRRCQVSTESQSMVMMMVWEGSAGEGVLAAGVFS